MIVFVTYTDVCNCVVRCADSLPIEWSQIYVYSYVSVSVSLFSSAHILLHIHTHTNSCKPIHSYSIISIHTHTHTNYNICYESAMTSFVHITKGLDFSIALRTMLRENPGILHITALNVRIGNFFSIADKQCHHLPYTLHHGPGCKFTFRRFTYNRNKGV